MSQTLTVTFDGSAFYPETQLNLEPNKRYKIQILSEEELHLQSNLNAQQLLEEAHQAFIMLRNDPQAWQEELEERTLWEKTLLDGNED